MVLSGNYLGTIWELAHCLRVASLALDPTHWHDRSCLASEGAPFP